MRFALRGVAFFVWVVVLPIAARAQANPSEAVGFEMAWNHVALSVPNIAAFI